MRNIQIISFLFFIQITTFGLSQNQNNTLNKLINETQKDVSNNNEMNLTWWIPYEFWELSLKSDPTFPQDQLKSFIDILKPYTIFAVVDGEMGPLGGVSYTSFESINNSIVLVDSNKNEYKQLNIDTIDPDVKNLLSIFKPIVQNLIGSMGENLHFFIFPDLEKEIRISNPYTKGVVSLKYNSKTVEWETPLASLLPPKFCPVDNKTMEGNWIYCPWHGEKLNESPNK